MGKFIWILNILATGNMLNNWRAKYQYINYKHSVPTSRRTNFYLITNTNRLSVYTTTVAVYCVTQKEQINYEGKMYNFKNIIAGGSYIYLYALNS